MNEEHHPGPALRRSRSWSRPHHQGAHHLGNAARNAARRHRQTSNLDPTPTCRTGTEREKNQLIDELSLRDQRLQQVDTIIADATGQNHSAKTKHHPPERPAKRGAIRIIKLVMDNQTLGQAIDQAKQELKTVRPQIANDKSPTTNRQRQIANDKSPTTNRRPNPATATTISC